MDISSLAPVAGGFIGGAIAGALSAWSMLGGPLAARLAARVAEELSPNLREVVIAGVDDALTLKLRAELVSRGLKRVRIAESGYRWQGEAVVLVADGLDLGDFVGRAGISEGVIYTKGRADAPVGDWSFANSRITLHARLLELIRWQAAAQKE